MGAGMLQGLGWIGARARWVLVCGCLFALAFPAIGDALRPVFPALVALVFAMAMARVDLGATARAALGWRRLRFTLGVIFVMIVVTPVALWASARAFGAPDAVVASLVYLGLSPPLASLAALSFLLGLDAALALELSVLASFLTPLVGPPLARLLLGAEIGLEPLTMALRLAAMIGAGALAAQAIRAALGPQRIARERAAFDGVATLAMLFFAFPLFENVGATVRAHPQTALAMLALAVLLNLGPQAAVTQPLIARLGGARAGTLGLGFGNRSIALYLAALPPDPLFGLFVALYQLPMYATPLIMGRFYRRATGP